MRRLLEIGFGGVIDINKLLGIPVNYRKPTALHLHHDSVAFFETVIFVPQVIFDLGDLAGHKGFGFFKAVAIFAPKNICSHQRPF